MKIRCSYVGIWDYILFKRCGEGIRSLLIGIFFFVIPFAFQVIYLVDAWSSVDRIMCLSCFVTRQLFCLISILPLISEVLGENNKIPMMAFRRFQTSRIAIIDIHPIEGGSI